MTLIVETPRTSYTGDGSTDTFATSFTFELTTEVTVWRGEPFAEDCCTAPDLGNLLALNVDYYWLPGDYLVDGGSIVVRAHAAIADGEVITLMRTTPVNQPEGFGDQETFEPEQLEATLDRITRMIQELYNNPLGVILLAGLAHAHRFYAPDGWTDQTPIDIYDFEYAVGYAAALAGSRASIEVYPESTTVISIEDQDGASIGSLTIPPDPDNTRPALTFAGEPWTSAVGGQMRFMPPEGGLGAGRGLSATILGAIVG